MNNVSGEKKITKRQFSFCLKKTKNKNPPKKSTIFQHDLSDSSVFDEKMFFWGEFKVLFDCWCAN